MTLANRERLAKHYEKLNQGNLKPVPPVQAEEPKEKPKKKSKRLF